MTATLRNGRSEAHESFRKSVADSPLWGELVGWNNRGGKDERRHIDLVNALRAAGLDERLARELLPRHAFTRACNKMAEARIIRKIDEAGDEIRFQFTAEIPEGEQYKYEMEAILCLDKILGKIRASTEPTPEKKAKVLALIDLAQTQLDRAMDARTTTDVTKVAKRVFENRSDLIPFLDQGGAYLVPIDSLDLVDRVEAYLKTLNFTMVRLPIPKGSPSGDRAVKTSVFEYLDGLIKDHDKAVDGFCETTRDSTLRGAAEALSAIRFKADAYSVALGEKLEELTASLAAGKEKLEAKIKEVTLAKTASAETEKKREKSGSATVAAGTGDADDAGDDGTGTCIAFCDHCNVRNDVADGAKLHVCRACKKEFALEW